MDGSEVLTGVVHCSERFGAKWTPREGGKRLEFAICLLYVIGVRLPKDNFRCPVHAQAMFLNRS